MKFTLASQDITNQASSLVNFHKRFDHFFRQELAIWLILPLITSSEPKSWFFSHPFNRRL